MLRDIAFLEQIARAVYVQHVTDIKKVGDSSNGSMSFGTTLGAS